VRPRRVWRTILTSPRIARSVMLPNGSSVVRYVRVQGILDGGQEWEVVALEEIPAIQGPVHALNACCCQRNPRHHVHMVFSCALRL